MRSILNVGNRDAPFDENAICDGCGAKGAFDLMGDFLCPKCCEAMVPDEPCGRCGCNPCECGE
jgi:hypothetical protein